MFVCILGLWQQLIINRFYGENLLAFVARYILL